MATIINYRLLLRGGPGTEWDNFDPVLMSREPGINTSTGGLKIGDGLSTWSQLDYVWGGEDYNLQIGTVTTTGDGTSAATITGTAPNQTLNLSLARGQQGDVGPQGPEGAPGPPPTITAGTVTTGLPGTNAAATITGTSPNLVLSLTIPRGNTGATGATGEQGPVGLSGDQGERGEAGPANTLTLGSVTTGNPGTAASATITGISPNQTLSLTLPRGDVGATGGKGDRGDVGPAGPPNTLLVGVVRSLASGATAEATITGDAPNQTLNLGIPAGPQGLEGATGPAGPPNSLTIGTTTTGAAGTSASASLTGDAPNQTLNLTLPRGDVGPAGSTGAEGPTGPIGPKGDPGAGVQITGSVATATDLDATPGVAGDAYLARDTGLLHVHDGTIWLPGVTFQGPEGPAGPTGPSGPANELTIGTVTTATPGSSASASVSGTPPNQTLSLVIPRGDAGPEGPTGPSGPAGPSNSLTIGTVTTGNPGTTASVTVGGTSPNQTLSFTIPRGNTGATGANATITGVTASELANGTPPSVSMGGTPEARTFSFGIPAGPKGDTGPAPTLTVGSVLTLSEGGSASAAINGTAPNYTLDLGLPTGATGATGPANTLTVGTVTTGATGTNAAATITGTAPNQTLNLTLPRGEKGDTGATGDTGPTGLTGPPNTITIGSVMGGTTASADITGTAPNQTLNLTLPKGDKGDTGTPGANGPANALSIGTVTTGAAGTAAAATVTGESPTQTLNLTIPRGDTGPANSLSIGTVAHLPHGETPTATITGTAPNQTLDFGLPTGPAGPPNSLAIGTISTVSAGEPAAATITGTPPNQTLNLTLPKGDTGTGLNLLGTVASSTALPDGTGLTAGDSYIADDTGHLWFWNGAAWVDSGKFRGDKGDPGVANTLTMGTTTTGAAGSSASATITGTSPNQTLALTIPRGNTGARGPNPAREHVASTLNTQGTYVGQWTRLATVRFTARYLDVSTNLYLLSTGSGSSKNTAAEILWRVKQQQALGVGEPYVSLYAGNILNTSIDAFRSVVHTNSSTETVVSLWMRVDQSYETIRVFEYAFTGHTFGITYHTDDPFQVAEPTGVFSVAASPSEAGTWHMVTGTPASGLGRVGDMALHTSTGAYWKKTSETVWTSQGNITGPAGTNATITGATATGLAAGSSPSVTMGGSESARSFNFGIPAGAKGDKGDTGAGVPVGGATGTMLRKNSATDYDASWVTPSGLAPSGGGTGTVLRKNSTTNYDYAWSSTGLVPTGGSAGQVLVKNSATNYDAVWGNNDPHWYGTQAAYDAITTKDANMTYFITA